jgi:hypothetical protein
MQPQSLLRQNIYIFPAGQEVFELLISRQLTVHKQAHNSLDRVGGGEQSN